MDEIKMDGSDTDMAKGDIRKDFKQLAISRPLPLIWGDRSESLLALLKDTSLPAIVRMNTKDQKGAEMKDPGQLLHKPLLLFKELKGIKVIARNISSLVAVNGVKDGVQYKEGGSVIVLPVDYQGWFRILDGDTVPLLNVANLARVMPASFLSTKRVPGFSLLDPFNKKDIMYEKLDFPPGVYFIHSVYEDHVKYRGEKGAIKKKLLRCLVCVAAQGIDVLVPFDVEGEFYIVESRKTHQAKNSKVSKSDKDAYAHTLRQLVASGVFTKPLVLKLLLGEPPNKPCGFTGVFKVFDIIKDHTVVASTIDGTRKLLELPVLPHPEFNAAVNGKDLIETGSLRTELLYLNGGAADKYVREIKVKASFNLPKPKIKQKKEETEGVVKGPEEYFEDTEEEASYIVPNVSVNKQ